MDQDTRRQALSFGDVADAYERARPSYPPEAARFLTGSGRSIVLELGAGTGKLTRQLVDDGHQVLATDPLAPMLAHLRAQAPEASAVVATAEHIPLPDRSVDVVVCAQAFHWFDHDVALPEIARVLRPGGYLALVWNQRDEGIPWVRRLGALLGPERPGEELTRPLAESPVFGWVEAQEFRNWGKTTRETLPDLVASRSMWSTLDERQREQLMEKVNALYESYGRGMDGMLVPYLTRCYRAVVKHPPAPPRARDADQPDAPTRDDPPDTDTLLIDFS